MSSSRGESQERETPFAGYGDRVGSGVALAPARWKGGELVSDPGLVTKSIRPRRMFYSPIGDGVVAADGVELKRLPPDLTPKVEVIRQRITEKGDPGKAGLKVTEKTWSSGGGGETNINAYGNQYGPGSGRSSAPVDGRISAPLNLNTTGQPNAGYPSPAGQGAGPGTGVGANDFGRNGTPSSFPTGKSVPTVLSKPAAAGDSYPPKGDNLKEPYRSDSADLYSSRSTLPTFDRNKSPTNGYPPPASGRTSATSSGLYEPGYRYEIKRWKEVTNPKELIHQYATTTPITSIDPTIETTTRTITKQRFSETIEEFGPFPPYRAGSGAASPLKFTKELRDQTLTESQRRANQNSEPANPKDSQYESKIREISRSSHTSAVPQSEIDQLTSRLVTGLGSQQKY